MVTLALTVLWLHSHRPRDQLATPWQPPVARKNVYSPNQLARGCQRFLS